MVGVKEKKVTVISGGYRDLVGMGGDCGIYYVGGSDLPKGVLL